MHRYREERQARIRSLVGPVLWQRSLALELPFLCSYPLLPAAFADLLGGVALQGMAVLPLVAVLLPAAVLVPTSLLVATLMLVTCSLLVTAPLLVARLLVLT